MLENILRTTKVSMAAAALTVANYGCSTMGVKYPLIDRIRTIAEVSYCTNATEEEEVCEKTYVYPVFEVNL